MFPPALCYAFDLETDNAAGHGLNPRKARITDASLATAGSEQVYSGDGEAALLTAFDEAIYDLPAGLIFTWNGTHFDLPFLDTRFGKCGIIHHAFAFEPTPMFAPKYELLPGHDSGLTARVVSKTGVHVHIDLMYAGKALAESLGVKWALKPVAAALGYEPVELDREHLDRYSDDERRAYAASDARVTRLVGMHVLGMDVALAAGRSKAA